MVAGKDVSIDLAPILGEADYIRLSGPKGLQISNKGVLTWTPVYGEFNMVLLMRPMHKVHRFKITVDDPAGGTPIAGTSSRPKPSSTRPKPSVGGSKTSPRTSKPPKEQKPEQAADTPQAEGPMRMTYACAGIAAAKLLPDLKTMVLSIPSRAELVFFDTEAFREIQKVSVEFKPGALAVQNNNLFVGAQGAASVYVLDAKTGKQKAEIEIPGAGVVQLACHPQRGLLYASTDDLKVYAIDTAAGKAAFSGGRGRHLAIDPTGQFVYTGTQPASEEEVNVIRQSDGSFRLIWDDWGARAFMAKYAVQGAKLELAGFASNAGVNAHHFALSADGDVVAMAGGGGWRPKAPTPGGGYEIVFFRTKDMTSTAGKVEVGAYPDGLAFHPILKLGVAYQSKGGNRLIVFHAKSFVTKQEISTANGPTPSAFLGFGDGGRKIVFTSDRGLHSLPLELSEDDLALLKNPPATKSSAAEVPAAETPAANTPAAETPAAKPNEGFPLRSWTDASGDYHIDARYAGFSNGNVMLIKRSGGRITMPLTRLSDEDQRYVRELQDK
jgi:hypothetical protein